MSRYPFLNFGFVILVIILFALQHSGRILAPGAYDGAAGGDRSDLSESFRAAANLSRSAAFANETWQRGIVIKQWLMEYKTTEWEVFTATGPAESDLLEARFHVANAAVFTQAMRDKERAIKELVRAETSLEAARTIIKAGLVPQLSTIREEITAAETHEQTEDSYSTVRFETIKTDLDHLIERVRAS